MKVEVLAVDDKDVVMALKLLQTSLQSLMTGIMATGGKIFVVSHNVVYDSVNERFCASAIVLIEEGGFAMALA